MFRPIQCNTTKTRSSFLKQLCAMFLLMSPGLVMAKTVLIETTLGNIEIELLDEDAPGTVANFLNYIENDRYNKTFIHRSIPGFIIQGGGFSFIESEVATVDKFPTITNEFKVSNTRGTVAMAKLRDDPNSATSQWFINLADNSVNLDGQNGGFTVFAKVIGNGMEVADAIASLSVVDAGSPFNDLPVIDYAGGDYTEENLVMTTVSEKPEQTEFVMNAGLNDAWYNPLTSGQGFFINVFPELGFVSLAWFTYDTSLPDDEVSANLGDAGHRWLTAIGTIEGCSSTMDIDITSGGLFDTATVVKHTDLAGSDGTITLSFESCSAGLVEYDIPSINIQGSVPIQRVANDNIALCEALTGE